jgi:hypothetical protein
MWGPGIGFLLKIPCLAPTVPVLPIVPVLTIYGKHKMAYRSGSQSRLGLLGFFHVLLVLLLGLRLFPGIGRFGFAMYKPQVRCGGVEGLDNVGRLDELHANNNQ